jgi:hypothetical protein
MISVGNESGRRVMSSLPINNSVVRNPYSTRDDGKLKELGTGVTIDGDGNLHVPGSGVVFIFEGEIIGEPVSTEIPSQPRWLELELYRVTDGTGRYVLHTVGRSVVYHSRGSSCNRGVPKRASDLFKEIPDAEPCRKCHPNRNASVYEMEIDKHTTYECTSAADVLTKLKESSRRHPDDPDQLSAPALRLLEMVSQRDEAIARAATVEVRL